LLTAGLIYALQCAPKRKIAIASATTLSLLALLPLASQLPDGYEASALVSQWSHVLASTPYDVELANTWSVALLVGATAVVCCLLTFRRSPVPVCERRS
jgi:hypothetical protein